MLIGYARVSTKEQETDLQLDALRRAGVDVIFEEKASSVGRRPQLRVCLNSLKPGDVFVVYKMDRIARSLQDLLALLAEIKAVGASIRSLTEPLDTGSSMGTFMIQILGAVAELERGIIRERSMAGQQAAKERGVHCGRSRVLTVEAEAEVVRLHAAGRHTLAAIALQFDVSDSVVKRAVYRVYRPRSSSLE